MKGATLFSDQRDLEDYIDMVLRNAKMLSGVELAVRGDTPEEMAASFLDALIKHGLAEVQDDKPTRIPIPALVWQGIDAVRLSGLTNMSGPANEPRGVPPRGPGRVFDGSLRVRRPAKKVRGARQAVFGSTRPEPFLRVPGTDERKIFLTSAFLSNDISLDI
jgi:hypothetical protein